MQTQTRVFWLMSLLFILSGATGLTYELIWIKRFAHVWGSSSLAMATVVACFLLGLGVGAQLFGRIADRLASPLRWYGFAELAIGLLALSVPFQLALLARVGGSLEAALPDQDAARVVLRFVLTLLIIGPASLLMGGTLPLLIRQGTAHSLSDATGWLYGVNTLGAALGCYLAGFHLLPAMGLLWTNNAAAALNLAIGAVALVLAREITPAARSQVTQTQQRSKPTGPVSRQFVVLVAAALTGCAALVLQMTWARQLALALGGSTYAYSATLFTVLIGIAVGGLLYHLALRRVERLETAVALIAFVVVASTVAGQQRLPWLCEQVGQNSPMRADLLGNAVVCVLASMVLQLIPSIGAGLLFPLLVQLTRQSAAHVGRVVGNVYLWNTAGSIVGASLTALVLFPAVGTAGAVTIAVGLYLTAVLFIWIRAETPLRGLAWGGLIGTVVCLALSADWPVDFGSRPDPRLTHSGMYLYGYSPAEKRLNRGEISLFAEGRSANVLVLNTRGMHSLSVNGKVDASESLDVQTQLGLAYVPRAFQPAAKDVLVIGYGSGATAGASLLFSETNVVCCEIEPAVYQASSLFNAINHAPEKSPRLEMVFDDGRSYLQRSGRKFDLIISEPSNPWMAGVGNLFTREFFESARSHLRPGGVLAQWVQMYAFSHDEYALILRTLRSVFPHSGLVILANGADSILLASDSPLVFDEQTQQQLTAHLAQLPAVEADLKRNFGSADFRSILLRHFIADETGLDRYLQASGPGPINTDLNLRLEFMAPRSLYMPSPTDDTARIAMLRTTESIKQLADQMGVDHDSGILLWALATSELAANRTTDAIELLNQAIETDPTLSGAYYDLAKLYASANEKQKAIELMQRLLPMQPDDAELRISLAALLTEQNPREAIHLYREALRISPQLLMARLSLAWLLATAADDELRDGVEATQLAEAACQQTHYLNGHCLDVLGAALAAQGDYSRAAHITIQAIERLQAEGQSTAGPQARLNQYNSKLEGYTPAGQL